MIKEILETIYNRLSSKFSPYVSLIRKVFVT